MKKLAFYILFSISIAIRDAEASHTYKNPPPIVFRLDYTPEFNRKRKLKKPSLFELPYYG